MSSLKSNRFSRTFGRSPRQFFSSFIMCVGLCDCDTNDEKEEPELAQQHEQQQQQQEQQQLQFEKPSGILHHRLARHGRKRTRRNRNSSASLPNLMQKDEDEDILGCCYCIKSQQVIVYKSNSTDFLAGFVITGSQKFQANLNSATWEPFYRSSDNVARETSV